MFYVVNTDIEVEATSEDVAELVVQNMFSDLEEEVYMTINEVRKLNV